MMKAFAAHRKSKILNVDGKPFEHERKPAALNATYDTAQTTHENQRLWQNATMNNINFLTDRSTRWTLMARARYTYRNNSYCYGMVNTIADDIIGRGPTIQITAENGKAADRLELEFMDWFHAIDAPTKLWQDEVREVIDGEAFLQLIQNDRTGNPVTLDLINRDAEYIHNPLESGDMNNGLLNFDGVVVDRLNNPRWYEVQPYDYYSVSTATFLSNPEPVSADYMIHSFRREHSHQQRGITQLASVLDLFEELRRYSMAVLAAAETAADMAVVLSTNSPPMGECQAIVSDPASTSTDQVFEMIDIPRRSMMIAPEGWRPEQIRAEQPVNTYDMFVDKILREIARCLSMPFNVAAGSSSDYNYASGRMDHQTYMKRIQIKRSTLERCKLSRIFNEWYRERELVGPMPRTGPISRIEWAWDEREHVDPLKEAQANAVLSSAGLLDYDQFWLRQKMSSGEAIKRQAEYLKMRREAGLEEVPNSNDPTPMRDQQGGRA